MAQLQIELEAAAADLEQVEAVLEAAGAMAQTFRADDGSVLLEPGVGEHPLWSRVRVTALFPGEADAERLIHHLAEQLGERAGAWRSERLEEQAWERAWLEHFRPMAFGKRLWVLPHEATVSLPEGAVAIRLDPGLAFGTGTHETTALCLEWLDGEPLAGARGIDYGAGSGVLAVAAALLGARECLAIDNDPQAVTATRENAANNGVADRVPACLPEQRPQAYCADFLVANILADTLAEQAAELLAGLAPQGRLALSGVLEGQQQRVMDAFGSQIAWDAPRRQGGWLLLSGTRL